MTARYDVAVVVGSLRAESFSRKIAEALAVLSKNLTFRFVDFRDLAMMNEDIEAEPPADWVRFREEIANADAFLFVTPEYNRSVPGALKNAIDVGSRPYGANAWSDRPAAIVSASIGQTGGFGSNHHLRQILTYLDVHVMDQPEAYIPNAAGLIDTDNRIVDERTLSMLQRFSDAFAGWIARHAIGNASARSSVSGPYSMMSGG